ncbi:EamA family transporter RarD [Saccharobesus litoralis]|uniref:EamA family transporter RarD n=1 Tax=Saccharobesus litoralis TaxID=2172099 RepID=A0A2S0VQB2_9ALTE|nr:EamA family transporter RarD [Saccharobesus litoralis]AWB66372.1 EamA family transporter RarD [Saccharobesus litoralis]
MNKETKLGLLLAIGAYSLWGLFPLYFKLLASMTAVDILAHRVLWSVMFLASLLLVFFVVGKKHQPILPQIKNKKMVTLLLAAAFMLAVNWLLFIWAVIEDRVLEASFGYFINPIVSVVIGLIFLKERLSQNQLVAILLVVLAVSLQVLLLDEVPWIALALAFSFGIYGWIKKQIKMNAVLGLFIETVLMLPVLIGYLILSHRQLTELLAFDDFQQAIILISLGAVTTIPLVLFGAAAQRINLSTLGMCQYIAPSLMFLLAVVYYQEPLAAVKLMSFVLIWGALIIYSWQYLMKLRGKRLKELKLNE